MESRQNRIPKIIHQIWLQGYENMPADNRQLVETIKGFHPDYEYRFYSSKEIRCLMTTVFKEFLETYDRLPEAMQQLDFFRYLLIYKYGGFYFDTDVLMHGNLDELLIHGCVFPVEQYNNDAILQENNFYLLLGQYAFGAEQHNEFMHSIIDDIITPRIDLKKYNISSETPGYIYYTTGPVMVSYCYVNYKDKEKITLIYPEPFTFGKFGIFATHRCHGLWKKKYRKVPPGKI